MKRKLKNAQMAGMLNQLRPILSYRDKIGYVAARNYRILSECLTEYEVFRNDLIEKYGGTMTRENGEIVFGIKLDSDTFKTFCDKMAPLNEIEQEVDLMSVKYEEVIGRLTGEEIISIDWMLED